MSVRELHAFINDRRIGILSEDGDVWAFAYDPVWESDPQGFDLSPALSRNTGRIVDGASERPVQWYFDNLLPEEGLRTIYAREARLASEDAFGLLAYFGAESAGSLVLLPPGQVSAATYGRRPLTDARRELMRLVDKAATEASDLIARIEGDNARVPEAARAQLAGEMRLLHTIDTVIVADMVARLR